MVATLRVANHLNWRLVRFYLNKFSVIDQISEQPQSLIKLKVLIQIQEKKEQEEEKEPYISTY